MKKKWKISKTITIALRNSRHLPYQCLQLARTRRAACSCRSSCRTQIDPQPDDKARPASYVPLLSSCVLQRVALRRASCAQHPGGLEEVKSCYLSGHKRNFVVTMLGASRMAIILVYLNCEIKFDLIANGRNRQPREMQIWTSWTINFAATKSSNATHLLIKPSSTREFLLPIASHLRNDFLFLYLPRQSRLLASSKLYFA